MRLAAIGFAAGVCLLQQQADLPADAQWLALAAVGVVLALAVHRLRAAWLGRVLIVMFAAVLGFGWSGLLAHWRLADALDAGLEGRDIVVSGVIASLPQPFDRGVRFEFDVESPAAGVADGNIPRHIQLAWYNGMDEEAFQQVQPVRAGERWRLTVRLRRPHGSANPHGFDYEAWLLERGIRATGYVRATRATFTRPERLEAFVARPAYIVESLREAIRERFWRALPDERYRGVLIALAIGDQRAISADDWQVFARTGVSHLMSISGLHVTMVSGLFAWFLFGLWCRVPALALRLPAQKAAALAGSLGALGYSLLSGFAVPAQRTFYMVTVVALALWFDRLGSASRVLALALLAVLLFDPWAVLSPGFWLSFGAVALIFYVSGGRLAERGWLRSWGVVQWAVSIGLAPLLLILFGQVSIASPLANALAIPVVSLVVTPLALAGAVLPFDGLLQLAHWVFEWLMLFLNWLSGMDAAVWQQHAPALWTLPLAMLGVAWLLAPRGIPARALGLVLMAPMFAVAPRGPAAGELWLTVLDVGQGLAVLARTRNHALLYDAGPMWSTQADSGNRIILPYLRGEGVSHLDVLAVSHNDNDHVGGARSVLAAVSTGRLVSSVPPDLLPDSPVRYRLPCTAGQRWEWDGVKFAWLHPTAEQLGAASMTASGRRTQRRGEQRTDSPNDLSCVLRIEAHGRSALLTGDIEKAAEGLLVAHTASGESGTLAADVLIVPHHGSGTSSTPAFVAAVSPAHAVFTVGYRNRFGHPRADVWERYAATSRERSDRDGAVSFRFTGAGMVVERQRELNRRYWQGR